MFRGLTRQEQGALIVLLVVIVFGVGLSQYDKGRQEQTIWLESGKEETSDTGESEEGVADAFETGLVNINTASQELLETLDGIGEMKARSIIEYRTAHGFFVTISDIQKVPGIGPALFESLKARITTGSGQEGKERETPEVNEESPGSQRRDVAAGDKKININTASVDEIKELKGIGEVLARRIVIYRQRHGGFKRPEELMNVEGIAEIKYKDNKDRLVVR